MSSFALILSKNCYVSQKVRHTKVAKKGMSSEENSGKQTKVLAPRVDDCREDKEESKDKEKKKELKLYVLAIAMKTKNKKMYNKVWELMDKDKRGDVVLDAKTVRNIQFVWNSSLNLRIND